MSKIVWIEQDQVREAPIPPRGFLTLGRGPDNEIRLVDNRVSRRHARLVSGPHGCLLMDLHSANGVRVNGRPVHNQFLKNRDLIKVGQQLLEFLEEENGPSFFDGDIDAVGRTATLSAPVQAQPKPVDAPRQGAFLRIAYGSDRGTIIQLDRPLTTVGDPGGFYAAVLRRTTGLHLLNLGRSTFTTLNGTRVHGAGNLLEDGDLIGLGDRLIEFRCLESEEH